MPAGLVVAAGTLVLSHWLLSSCTRFRNRRHSVLLAFSVVQKITFCFGRYRTFGQLRRWLGCEAAAGVLEGPPKLKLLVGFPVPKVKVGFEAAGVVVAALAAPGALAACPNGVGAVLDMGG